MPNPQVARIASRGRWYSRRTIVATANAPQAAPVANANSSTSAQGSPSCEPTSAAYPPTVTKAAWAKLMIFITPNTIRSPDEMMKSRAAVVTVSRARVSMLASGPDPRETGLPSRAILSCSGFRRALRARIDIGEGPDHLDAAVCLDLSEIHGQRRVPLLVHADGAARPIDGNFGQSRQHLLRVGTSGLFHRGLVGIDPLIFRYRQVVRRLEVRAELLAHGREERLVGGAVD